MLTLQACSTERSLTRPRLCLPQVEGQLVPFSSLSHIQLQLCLRGTAAGHAAGAAAAVAVLACSCSYVRCATQAGPAWTQGSTCRNMKSLLHVLMLALYAESAALDARHMDRTCILQQKAASWQPRSVSTCSARAYRFEMCRVPASGTGGGGGSKKPLPACRSSFCGALKERKCHQVQNNT